MGIRRNRDMTPEGTSTSEQRRQAPRQATSRSTPTGATHVAVVFILCPHCNDALEAPDGSTLIDPIAFSKLHAILICLECGKTFAKPVNPFVRK